MPGPFNSSFTRTFLRFGVLPLLFIAGVQLFVLSANTATFFAWTITPPLTAAFMGAGYWAAMCAAFMGLRHISGGLSTTSIPASFAATTMLGIATFLHIDKFHLASPLLLTRFVTWVWVAVYIVTPPIFLVALIRMFGMNKSGEAADRLPRWLRFGFFLHGLLIMHAGIFLFLEPARMIPVWPWALTSLTARAVGTWLAAYGLACLAVFRENNLRSSADTIVSLLAFCVLQLLVAAFYFTTIDWTKPMGWAYIFLLIVGGICSVVALRANRVKMAAAPQAA